MQRQRPDYQRGANLVRAFTPGEDEQLESMRVAGMTLRAIAIKLGRSHSSVQMRLQALAAARGDDEW